MTTTKITKHAVADDDFERSYKLFGASFSTSLEPYVYHAAAELSPEYKGGTWGFFDLSNGGFLMSPRSNSCFNAIAVSGERIKLSAEGLGIASCLCAFSRLSFARGADAERFARHYYLLRALMFEHLEVPGILGVTD